MSLPAGPKLVVKWGEHREYSETIFLMNRREKTQEEFILKNEQNSLEEWDGQYIYQGWDGTNFSDVACCRKNLMFVNMGELPGVWGRIPAGRAGGCGFYRLRFIPV